MFKRKLSENIDELAESAAIYLKANYEEPHIMYQARRPSGASGVSKDNYDLIMIERALQRMSSDDPDYLTLMEIRKNMNMSFVDKMLDHMKSKHLRNSAVYKAAQMDRRLFSKIASDRTYNPSKDTCIALAMGMKLSLSEANDILSRAGYTLSHSSKRDVIIEYYINSGNYNLIDLNEILFRLGEKPIGR